MSQASEILEALKGLERICVVKWNGKEPTSVRVGKEYVKQEVEPGGTFECTAERAEFFVRYSPEFTLVELKEEPAKAGKEIKSQKKGPAKAE